MFANDNYLEEPQDTEFKGTIISFIREFKDLREDTKKQVNEIKEKAFTENPLPEQCPRNYKHKTNGNDSKNPGIQ